MNFVYAWCLARIDPEKSEEWHFMLNQPLPGREKKVTAMQAEDEGEGFMALMAQVNA